MCKKIIAIVIVLLTLSSCSYKYYDYYEVNSLEDVNYSTLQDAVWRYNRKTPTRCVGVYRDSTGKVIYLMESKMTKKSKDL